MGGPIAIAARFNDRETICVEGWTNFTPRMVINADTLTGKDDTVRRTLLEVASHSSYGGPQPFRASGYGMLAIDFVARQIHTLQGYTSFDSKMLTQLLDINATGWRGDTFVNVLSEESEWLLAQGKVTITHLNGEPHDEPPLTRDRAIELLNEETRTFMSTAPRATYMLAIDTSPFEVFDYGEQGSLAAMKQRLRDAGFPMTKANGLNAMFAKSGTTEPTGNTP